MNLSNGSTPTAATTWYPQRPARSGFTRVVNSIHKVGDAVHTTYFDVGPQTPPAPAGSGRPNAADAIAGEASGEPADCAVGAYV